MFLFWTFWTVTKNRNLKLRFKHSKDISYQHWLVSQTIFQYINGSSCFHKQCSHSIYSGNQMWHQTFQHMHIITAVSITIGCPWHRWVVRSSSTSNQAGARHLANIQAMVGISKHHQSTIKHMSCWSSKQNPRGSRTQCSSNTSS